ncbi:2TM domain-containing protein [Methanogenium organophilum]|uniref:2TM domain-containing protein n=1 Tax=Methanogenium organophilum TaxID=2199 RepID=A0A9X9S5I6_METOG|nr:2TM domain-containing protein [Methanogenium organophilum]WAI02504.1 2TM domain-containing protein [Methanogenium organophilum]
MQNEKDFDDRDGNDENSGGLLADPPVRGLVYHAVLYLGVVLVLLAVNLRITPDILWVQWIALLWGILLVWNGWKVFWPGDRHQR